MRVRKKTLRQAAQYTKQNRRRRIWRRIVSVLACIVVFCTTYALILPAITQEKDTICGLEEHTHSESCYAQITSEEVSSLVCTYETLGIHTHTQDCYDESGALICAVADCVLHTHDASCVDGAGTLVCQLPEVTVHTHTAQCYETDADGVETLVCQLPEIVAHTHTDECYEIHTDESGLELSVLVCAEQELQEHIHSEACFETVETPVDTGSLTCGLEESETHAHTALCYGTWELVCGLEEHTHTEECEASSDLTEEELAQAQAVIDAIEALESADQVDEKLAAFEEAEDWEGYAAYREEAALNTQAVRDLYGALSDAQKQKIINISKLLELSWLVPTTVLDDSNKGTIRDYLEGDWAYITDFMMKADTTTTSGTYLRTGTSPWDDDDEAGNDSTELNSILRTFDTATYTIQFNTALRDAVAQEDVGGIKQGRLYFEFVLPLSEEEARFETDSMGWLQSSQDIKYESVIATVNGVESQVLRGSFTMVPTGSNEAAIGASTNELSVVVRAMKMHNGDTIEPTFTLWLQHNQVGATYNAEDDRLPASIVTGTNVVCPETDSVANSATGETVSHGCEAATMTGTEITISARGMFNIAIVGFNSQNTRVGTYNFDATSNTGAINYGIGMIEGRLNGYGLVVELLGKTGQGMRGCEFPDEGTPITFDIDISSGFDPTGSVYKLTSEPNYKALFWSGGANAGGTSVNPDGRTCNTTYTYIQSAPYNKYYSEAAKYKGCYNGGSWSFSETEDGKIRATITNFDFNTSLFPQTNAAGNQNTYTYYNPANVSNYWDITEAVFSAGELWVVQPYYGLEGTDDEGVYIAAKYDLDGQFYTRVEISNLNLRTEGGEVVTTQSEPAGDTNDNVKEQGQYLKQPGNIDGRVVYLKDESRTYNDTLTDGCFNSSSADADWATAGSGVTLVSWVVHDGAEADYTGVAYDNLIKFDDEFFLPDTDAKNFATQDIKSTQSCTLLWAALPDGGGWTDDEHMKSATPDDLVFYASLDELYADGKTAVGAMLEIRGLSSEGAQNHPIFFVDGMIKSTAESGKVYMITRCTYAWQKKDVAAQALAYHNTKYPDNQYGSTAELTDADYIEYAQDSENGFPSHLDPDVKVFEEDDRTTATGDYPTPFWWQDYYRTCTRGSNSIRYDGTSNGYDSALSEIYKASYSNGIYTPGKGAYYYQDSCLVMSFDATITKSTAQTEKDSQDSKSVYDMGQNQRTVDYVLNAKISRVFGDNVSTGSELDTVVYIEDTLPASLTYIPGSAYYGGTYTQDPTHQSQGTCDGVNFESTSDAGTSTPTDAHPYLETVTTNADGTTTILWMFQLHLDANTTNWTEEIYFSCSIGTPGVESTDVQNGDSIVNTVKIWAEGVNQRPYLAEYGNLDTYGITILKTSAVSLSKISDQLVMNWWEDFGFTMNVGNNSGNLKSGTVIVETLPFNGLYRSDYTGRLLVSEFSAAVVDANNTLLTDSFDNFVFYYTTSADYAGWRSSDFAAQAEADGLAVADWLAKQAADAPTEWFALTFADSTTEVNSMTLHGASLPTTEAQEAWGTYDDGMERQITAIVAVGDLPANATMKMHVTVQLPDGDAGDYMVNYLSQDSLTSYARAQAVNRSIEGLTWLDRNENGIQDDGEPRLSGVKAVLCKWSDKDNAYVQCHFQDVSTNNVIYVQTGYMVSYMADSRADAVPYEEGRYKFTDLPDGKYAIQFKTGDIVTLSEFLASPENQGSDDTVDSDGVPSYDSSGALSSTWIEGIVMKEATELVYGIEESKYHDSGFHYPSYVLPSTGGAGTTAYTMAGLVLICISTAGLLYRSKARRREVT